MTLLGQQQCRQMRSGLNSHSYYYFNAWLAYCSNFGQSASYKLHKDLSRFTRPSLNISRLKISNIIGSSKKAFSNAMTQAIQNHLWFNQQAKAPLRLSLEGKINYSKKTTPHTFSFIYPAKKEIFEVIKDKNNPKIIKRKLIKVIPTEKTVRVKGQSHLETVSHNLALTGKINNFIVAGSELAADKVHQTYAHQANFQKKTFIGKNQPS